MTNFILLLFIAYLLGSVPTGKLVALRLGVDIQKKGSGNIGFANALRVLGWKPAIIVLLGDLLKGFLPTFYAVQHLTQYQIEAVGLMAILGHIYPLWLRFRGGKGIATGLGVSLAINPYLGFAGLIAYCISILILRKSGPSSVLAAWTLPLCSILVLPPYFYYFVLLACLATYTHRKNIREFLYAS